MYLETKIIQAMTLVAFFYFLSFSFCFGAHKLKAKNKVIERKFNSKSRLSTKKCVNKIIENRCKKAAIQKRANIGYKIT